MTVLHEAAPALKALDRAGAERVSALFDELLDLEPDERTPWLDRLAAHEPRLAALVAGLLEAAAPRAGVAETAELIAGRIACSVHAAPASLTGRRFGPYRVLGLLGEGGMGVVWRAERADGLFEREVALKLVHPGLVAPALMERFARERRILAALVHPNIARLFDAGVGDEGQPYLALELVEGTPLDEYCDRERLTVRERLALMLQVLGAVQHAHQNLVIHRDLKPGNILVGTDGQVHLLDFGIATLLEDGDAAVESALTRAGGRALTPRYASPEQLAGQPVGTASDVYSLGSCSTSCSAAPARSASSRNDRASSPASQPRRRRAAPRRGSWRMRSPAISTPSP
jgi:eukaryotic-like serine/threonine-protein kinase